MNEARLAEDLRMLFDRVQGLDPQLVMVADPEGVAAAVTIDEEQVRPVNVRAGGRTVQVQRLRGVRGGGVVR